MSQSAECAFANRALIPAWPVLRRFRTSRVRMAPGRYRARRGIGRRVPSMRRRLAPDPFEDGIPPAGEPVIAVADQVLGGVVLVVVFGGPEGRRRNDLGDDRLAEPPGLPEGVARCF